MKEKNGEHPWGDAGQILLAGVFLVVWAGDSFFLEESTFLATHVPLPIRLALLGVSLFAGMALFRATHPVVCSEPRPDRVVATGVFRYVRHPLYLSAIVTYLGLSLSTLSFYSLAMLVGVFVFYNFIAGYDERHLEIKFGQEYLAYKNATGKWIPSGGKGVQR